jgi:hypothetical protein
VQEETSVSVWERWRQRIERDPKRAASIARLAFRAQLLRLRLDSWVGTILSFGRQRRIASTACWSFPIYSQTFVYQELTQLINRGYSIRFLYGQQSTDALASQFNGLWRARRRLIMHDAACEESYRYFVDRAPDAVERLLAELSLESGIPRADILNHYHVRQAFGCHEA